MWQDGNVHSKDDESDLNTLPLVLIVHAAMRFNGGTCIPWRYGLVGAKLDILFGMESSGFAATEEARVVRSSLWLLMEKLNAAFTHKRSGHSSSVLF